MAKYSKGAQKSVESSMKRMEKGKLENGRSGKKVTNPKQAIAIGLSEARKKGAKVPAKKTASKAAPKKAAPKKATVKKAAPKKAQAKKSAAPKKTAKKAAPEKAVAKKPAARPKSAAKAPAKAAATKTAPKKTPAKKTAPKKAVGKKSFADKNLDKKAGGTTINNEETGLPEYNETAGKAANTGTGTNESDNTDNNEPQIKDDGLKAPEKIEDPITAADQKGYNKATAKGDPHQKLHLSQAKGGIKPSGKKPLWNK